MDGMFLFCYYFNWCLPIFQVFFLFWKFICKFCSCFMNGLFLFCYHFNGFSPIFEVFILFYKNTYKFCSYFVIILMGFHLFLRYFFYSRSTHVSFVSYFRSLLNIFKGLFLFYLFSRYLFFSRSSNVSFIPIFERFVPILFLF